MMIQPINCMEVTNGHNQVTLCGTFLTMVIVMIKLGMIIASIQMILEVTMVVREKLLSFMQSHPEFE